MAKVTIDGQTIEVADGTTILNAARQIGGPLVPPAMCYYSTLKGSGGKCRTCLVRVTKGSEKDPRPMPKLVASCQTMVMDGMEVASKSDATVVEARAAVTEFLLINHPLDCPICDQAGECHLQDLSFEHGKASTRYEFERRTFEKIDIGPYIKLHMTRCIMCFRCVYVANQLTNERVHGILNRGDHVEISTYIEKAIDNDFSGNVIDVCPVGALTDRTFRFKSRVWFLNPMDAHRNCDKCSGKALPGCTAARFSGSQAEKTSTARYTISFATPVVSRKKTKQIGSLKGRATWTVIQLYRKTTTSTGN